MAALNFYTSGSFQDSTGDLCGIFQVSTVIHGVTDAIFAMAHNYVNLDRDQANQDTRALGFARFRLHSLLDKLQHFLPQIAKANEELKRQMETSEPGRFDIENIEDCPDKVIEMNVSLFELNGSDESGEEELTSEGENSQFEGESFGEVTEANLKLHRAPRQRKSQIEVLSSDDTK
ncbi:NOP protein chaperone 1 [Cetorhinus maximus]